MKHIVPELVTGIAPFSMDGATVQSKPPVPPMPTDGSDSGYFDGELAPHGTPDWMDTCLEREGRDLPVGVSPWMLGERHPTGYRVQEEEFARQNQIFDRQNEGGLHRGMARPLRDGRHPGDRP